MITPEGQLRSVVTEVEPGRVYADQTVLGDLVLTFRYQLTPTGTGGTHVRHTLKSTVTARMRSVPSSVH